MNGVILYIKESYNELINKVTWPSWPDLLDTTTVVVIGSAIITLMTFVMDIGSNVFLDLVYPKG